MAVGSEGDSAGLTAERTLHVVDVHVETQLGLPVELLVAEGTFTLPIITAKPANTRGVTHEYDG